MKELLKLENIELAKKAKHLEGMRMIGIEGPEPGLWYLTFGGNSRQETLVFDLNNGIVSLSEKHSPIGSLNDRIKHGKRGFNHDRHERV